MSPTVDSNPIDLHLRVTTDRNRRGEQILVHQLTSPSGRASVYRLEEASQPLGDRAMLRATMVDELQRLIQGAYTESSRWTTDRIESKLQSFGRNLYLRVFPQALRRTFDELAVSGDLSLQIESDETEVPWEVLHTNGRGAGFLCLRFSLARWLGQSTPPRAEMCVGRVLGIESGTIIDAETRKPMPPLRGTQHEIGILGDLGETTGDLEVDLLSDATLESVRQHLALGAHDLIHFAGHSDFLEGRADRAVLHFNGGDLEAQDLVGQIAEALGRRRPLILLNSCRAGIQERAVTGVGGWPQRFVEVCGCGAFVGPQWTIRNSSALRFARAFYQALTVEETLGEALRRARLERRPTHPTYSDSDDPGRFDPNLLAYCFFGNPNARVRFGADPVGTENDKGHEGLLGRPAGARSRRAASASGPADRFHHDPPTSQTRTGSARSSKTLKNHEESLMRGKSAGPFRSRDREEDPPDTYGARATTQPTGESSGTRFSFGDLRDNSGPIVMGDMKASGNATIDNRSSYFDLGTHIHKNDGPSTEERLREEALHYFQQGRRALDVGDFEKARQYLELADERDHLEGVAYLRALAHLGSRRPRVLSWPSLRGIETLLLRAYREGEGSHAALFLAFVKQDFYPSKGRVQEPPTAEDLLDQVRARLPDPERLEELCRWTPIEGFIRRRAPWMQKVG